VWSREGENEPSLKKKDLTLTQDVDGRLQKRKKNLGAGVKRTVKCLARKKTSRKRKSGREPNNTITRLGVSKKEKYNKSTKISDTDLHTPSRWTKQ